MIFFVLLITGTDIVSGAILDVTSPQGYNPVDTAQFGVDINRCKILIFKIKSCANSHILLGDGTKMGSYEIIIGGWENTKSGFRHCAQGCYNTDRTFPTVGILECSAFRPFWFSWGKSRLSFGRGNAPFTNIIFDEANPDVHAIKTLSVVGYDTGSATLRLGDETKSVFEAESMHDAKYNTVPLSQVNTNVSNCSRSCHENTNCGMFSFNKDRSECMLFDRKTPSSILIRQSGWKTWKIQYCWA